LVSDLLQRADDFFQEVEYTGEDLTAGSLFSSIPICCLPYEDFIDWKKHCVWIEEKERYGY